MKRAFLSALLALALCLGLPQVPVRAAGNHTLGNQGDLRALLESSAVKDGDTITISGTVNVNDTNSDAAPWVIGKNVTITGSGVINLRAGGILLGADVTFDGVTLLFANRVRSAIMANGHTLTLHNVSEEGTAVTDVHLFCGGLTGHSANATPGEHGKLVLQGGTSLAGDLYAGSISCDGYGNAFTAPASILIDSAFSGSVGNIYGCGALETYVDPNDWFSNTTPAPPAANPQAYKATGGVHIQVNNKAIKPIDGATGGSANASLSFADAGKGYNFIPSLANIATLSLLPSDNGAELTLGENDPLSSDAGIILPANTKLNLSALGETVSLGSLEGGGTLILGQTQTLSFSGDIQGSTAVAVGGLNYEEDSSTSLVLGGHPYINAPFSQKGSFGLIPDQVNFDWVLNRGTDGTWTAGEKEEGSDEPLLLVRSASIPAQVDLDAENYGADVPLTVEYAQRPNENYNLGNIPMELSLNGVALERYGIQDYYEWHPAENESAHAGVVYLTVLPDDVGGGESLAAIGTGTGDALPTGSYAITFTIPGDYMADGQPESLSLTITVGSSEPLSPGDVNGDGKVTLSDAVRIARHVVQAELITDERGRGAADFDGNTLVNVQDVQQLCLYLVGGS